jgi:hypothetical protein
MVTNRWNETYKGEEEVLPTAVPRRGKVSVYFY